MKKRLLASLMALSLVVSMIPMNAFAEGEGTETGDSSGTTTACTHEHHEPVEEVKATCVATGVKAHFKCLDCNKLFEDATLTHEVTEADLEIPTTDEHLWSEYVSNEDATCDKDGTKTAKCTREGCEAEDTKTDEGTKGCTYPEDAWDYTKTKHWAVCSVCGKTSAEEEHEYEFGKDVCSACGHLREHEHALKFVDAVDATCTKDGNTAYYVCVNENCGLWFEDETATKVIENKESVVLAKLGHENVRTSNNDATCVKDGTATLTCSRCGNRVVTQDKDSKLGHDFEYVSNNDATCTADGTETGKCSRCDKTDTRVKEGSALNHEFLDENYVSNGNATCTADGTETAKCSRCDETNTRVDKGSVTGHTWQNATCTEPKKCTNKNCNATEGDALNHDWDAYVSDNNATCTENGTETRTCKREGCNAKDSREIADSALGHTWKTEWTMDSANHWKECSNCDAIDGKAAHAFEEGDKCSGCGYIRNHVHRLTLVAAVDSTCTEEGNTAYYTCSGCEDWFADAEGKEVTTDHKSVVVAEKGHDFTEYKLDNNETCTANGTKTAKCNRTGCTATDTVVVENTMLGHSFTNYVSDNNASCTEKGTKTAKCDRCTQTNTVVDEASVAEHKFGNWTTVNAATCTEAGTQKRVCSACEKEETATIEAKGHVWDTKITVDKAATCTEAGSESIHCTACEATKDAKEIPVVDHVYGDYISDNNATCTEDGTKTRECKNCGAKDTVAEDGSKIAHNYATTWSKGEEGHWYECTVCAAKVSLQIHTFDGDICRECGYERNHVHRLTLIDEKDVTCTADGNTAHYECSGCEEWFEDAEGTKKIEDKTAVVIPAMGHDLEEATCTEPVTCNNEGCTYTEGQALGHNYNKDKVCERCEEEKPSAQIEFLETSKEVVYNGKAYALSESIVEAYDATGEIFFRYYVDENCEVPTFEGKSNEGKAASAAGVYYVKAVVAEDDTYVETETEETYVITIKPRKVDGASASNQNSSIKLTWGKSSEATGYIIYRRAYGTDVSEYKVVKTITSNSTLSYTDGNISQGKRYIYSIAAYKDAKDGTRVIGNKLSKAVQIVRIKIKSVENKNGSVKLTWSKIPGAAGYKIYRKAAGMEEYGYLKNVKSGTTTTYTDKYAKSLKNGNASYYYVEVYFDDDSTGVMKSNTKTHYYLKRPTISSVTAASKALTVKWDKNTGGSGYEIMCSTSSSFDDENTVVLTISGKNKVSKKINELKKNKKYYVKVRTYKEKESIVYYSAWSEYKSVKTK